MGKKATEAGDSAPMRFCPYCGAELKAGGKFCPACGSQLQRDAAAPPEEVPSEEGKVDAEVIEEIESEDAEEIEAGDAPAPAPTVIYVQVPPQPPQYFPPPPHYRPPYPYQPPVPPAPLGFAPPQARPPPRPHALRCIHCNATGTCRFCGGTGTTPSGHMTCIHCHGSRACNFCHGQGWQ